jgi:hypothetical protein
LWLIDALPFVSSHHIVDRYLHLHVVINYRFVTFCSDEVEDELFWPYAEAAAATYGDRELNERDPQGGRWPLCYGQCSAGKCVLDKSHPGCSYKRGGKRGHEHSPEVEHVDRYSTANLMCWAAMMATSHHMTHAPVQVLLGF